jgi:hypothetical protein
MAELTVSVRREGPGGRASIRIGYRADADATPHEHEIRHRRLVSALFPGLEITDDRGARVRVQREKPAQEPVVG